MPGAAKITIAVLKRSGPADAGTRHESCIDADSTLAGVREVLIEDGIMGEQDRFNINGCGLGKSAEGARKYADICLTDSVLVIMGNDKPHPHDDPKPAESSVDHTHSRPQSHHDEAEPKPEIPTVTAAFPVGDQEALEKAKFRIQQDADYVFADPKRIAELDDLAKELILFNSGLGQGIDISDPSGPNDTGHPIVEGFNIASVHWKDAEAGGEDVVISYSARATAYAKRGWTRAAMSIDSPFVTGSSEVSMEMTSSNTSSASRLYVTGRYLYSKCQVTLGSGFKLNPEFKEAVENALNAPDDPRRKLRLAKVFKQYGHVYVESVEMGGMKHTTTTATKVEAEDTDSISASMKQALGKKFGPLGLRGSLGGGKRTTNSAKQTKTFESEVFTTVGGITEENNVTRWKASVSNHAN